jgi:hypothetical protein
MPTATPDRDPSETDILFQHTSVLSDLRDVWNQNAHAQESTFNENFEEVSVLSGVVEPLEFDNSVVYKNLQLSLVVCRAGQISVLRWHNQNSGIDRADFDLNPTPAMLKSLPPETCNRNSDLRHQLGGTAFSDQMSKVAIKRLRNERLMVVKDIFDYIRYIERPPK